MKFSDVIGNEGAIARIRRMVDDNRVPHALLLHGDPGTPKLALAQAAAQYIHCTNRQQGEPCGKCPSCLQHQSYNHADTFFSYPVVAPAGKTTKDVTSEDFFTEWKQFLAESPVEDFQRWVSYLKKDNAQPLIYAAESDLIVKQMSFAAYTSAYKVLIMWLPEKMNETCANKLLKIIEEPYPDCIFILVSNDAKSILPTILSRTQRIKMNKPTTEQIARYLAAKHGIDMQDALAMAAPADGDVAQAEHNLSSDSETKQFFADFVKLMRTAWLHDLKGLKAWSDAIADYKREKCHRFLDYCCRMVRENFIYNLHHPELNYLTRDEAQFSTKFAPFINEANVERITAEFNRALHDIAANGNARIVLFDMCIRISILIR